MKPFRGQIHRGLLDGTFVDFVSDLKIVPGQALRSESPTIPGYTAKNTNQIMQVMQEILFTNLDVVHFFVSQKRRESKHFLRHFAKIHFRKLFWGNFL